MNLPNLITLGRIALVPALVWLLLIAPALASWERLIALGFFILAIATDGLDGAIARRTNTVTNLGKILDPIADKALIGGTLLVLSVLGEVSWWITAAILLREGFITIYRIAVIRREVIAASLAGKLKTIFQAIAIASVLAPIQLLWPQWEVVSQLLLWLAVALTLYSGAQILRSSKR